MTNEEIIEEVERIMDKEYSLNKHFIEGWDLQDYHDYSKEMTRKALNKKDKEVKHIQALYDGLLIVNKNIKLQLKENEQIIEITEKQIRDLEFKDKLRLYSFNKYKEQVKKAIDEVETKINRYLASDIIKQTVSGTCYEIKQKLGLLENQQIERKGFQHQKVK